MPAESVWVSRHSWTVGFGDSDVGGCWPGSGHHSASPLPEVSFHGRRETWTPSCCVGGVGKTGLQGGTDVHEGKGVTFSSARNSTAGEAGGWRLSSVSR